MDGEDPGPVVQALVRPVVRTGCTIVNWLYVAAQLVGDDDTRVAELSRQPAQEPLCSLRIPARLHQNIEDISCRVDRAPEPVCLAVDHDDHLVQMPFVARVRAIPLDAVGKVSAKPVDPVSNAFPTDNYAALGEQTLDIGSAQGKPVIGPNSIGDDLVREIESLSDAAWKLVSSSRNPNHPKRPKQLGNTVEGLP